MMRSIPGLLVAATLAIGGQALARSPYKTSGSCDGLPKVDLKTAPGFCVGLVAEGFRFPRGLLVMADGDLIVADMAGWIPRKGSLWRLSRRDGAYQRTRLLAGIDRPNGLTLGPDGLVYVGAVGRLFRFDPVHPDETTVDVIGGSSAIPPLPDSGRHPLTQMVFDRRGDLFVNVGSASDNCEQSPDLPPESGKPCAERSAPEARGVIRKYVLKWPGGQVDHWSEYARGLRNSMALAIHPTSGELWQGENSRDTISARDPALSDADLPHDELNLVRENADYGWPYCYDHNVSSPEYAKWDCQPYTPPQVLLPAHAAPLGMSFHSGSGFPKALQGALIVGFHGYRATGHRLVAYPFSPQGRPAGKPVELIFGWDSKPTAPMGAPVDVRVGSDGSVYLSEDRNGTILRLVYTEGKGR